MKFWGRLVRDKCVAFGFIIILIIIFTAIFAPHLAPHDPYEQNLLEGLSTPSAQHPLGQDKLGRDVLSRIIYGSRISVMVGFFTVTISLLIGTLIGSVAGYFGGFVDEVFMRIVDILLAFPGILLAIALMTVLGPSLNNVILALCIVGWVGYARLARGQILSLREREYIIAARAAGLGTSRIILHHIIPNIISPLIVQATFGIAGAIIAEAGLSFLGIGTQPPMPSWGAMLNDGRQFLLTAPHLTTYPGIAIMLTVLGLNFLGDGIRDLLDPKGEYGRSIIS
ncbi:MAG: nickel transporter permease [bacterium]